jgi:hypothetical protein
LHKEIPEFLSGRALLFTDRSVFLCRFISRKQCCFEISFAPNVYIADFAKLSPTIDYQVSLLDNRMALILSGGVPMITYYQYPAADNLNFQQTAIRIP